MKSAESAGMPSKTLNRQKLIIADDDTPTRILLKAAVSQWNYEVLEARDGEEAWNIVQTLSSPCLMLVDWLMPKLNGLDLCIRIKQEISDSPYIILLTQMTGSENVTKGLESGADEFLSKPFNMPELRSRLAVGAKILNYKKEVLDQSQKINTYANSLEVLAQKRALEIVDAMDIMTISAEVEKLISTRTGADNTALLNVSSQLKEALMRMAQLRS